MRKILMHAHLAVENAKWTDPHTKANALLQAHFARSHLSGDMQADQAIVVPLATRLLQARHPMHLMNLHNMHTYRPSKSSGCSFIDLPTSSFHR